MFALWTQMKVNRRLVFRLSRYSAHSQNITGAKKKMLSRQVLFDMKLAGMQTSDRR